MNDFYERMNVRNCGKTKVAQYILENFNSEKTLVLDLGAGTCVIDQLLLENGFKGDITAIDRQPKSAIEDQSHFKFIRDDLINALTDLLKPAKQYKRVVIILSAILHELSKKDLIDLAALIRIINRSTYVYMIIREPVITNALIAKEFVVIDEEDFETYKSLHKHNNWTERIAFINYCFLKSYGEGSWEREKNEGRFTFTCNELSSFINSCGCKTMEMEFEKDEFYKDTLPHKMYQKISYTGTLTVCRRK